MNIDRKSKHTTTSSEQSWQLAVALARAIEPPQVIELVGDLGGGKTTFVKGLAAGFGIGQVVTSPTFTIHRAYKFDGGSLEHFDLYRLQGQDRDVVIDELAEAIADPQAVVAIEWAKPAERILPSDRLIIEFDFVDENTRDLNFAATGPKSTKLLEALR